MGVGIACVSLAVAGLLRSMGVLWGMSDIGSGWLQGKKLFERARDRDRRGKTASSSLEKDGNAFASCGLRVERLFAWGPRRGTVS